MSRLITCQATHRCLKPTLPHLRRGLGGVSYVGGTGRGGEEDVHISRGTQALIPSHSMPSHSSLNLLNYESVIGSERRVQVSLLRRGDYRAGLARTSSTCSQYNRTFISGWFKSQPLLVSNGPYSGLRLMTSPPTFTPTWIVGAAVVRHART